MSANQPATHRAAPILAHRTLEGLARVLGGRLQLAKMPPVQGPLAPFARVVRQVHEVRSADVLLPWADRSELNGTKAMQQSAATGGSAHRCTDQALNTDRVYRWWEAHQAYQRGAAAVVSQEDGLEAWAGRSVIIVDDLETAARRWQQCCLAAEWTESLREQRRLRRGGRNCGISTLPSLLG